MGHWVSLCVCIVVGWLIVYQLDILSLSFSQYIQTICWCGWDDNACLGVRNTWAWPNSLDRRRPWYCIVSPLLQTIKDMLPLPGWNRVNISTKIWWGERPPAFHPVLTALPPASACRDRRRVKEQKVRSNYGRHLRRGLCQVWFYKKLKWNSTMILELWIRYTFDCKMCSRGPTIHFAVLNWV